MPIYEYECSSCGHIFDALQKMSDDALKDCPACGEPELRKLLSAPNFRLKGGGWYETDFKDGNKRNLAGDAGKTETKKSDTEQSSSTSSSDSSNSSSNTSSNSSSSAAAKSSGKSSSSTGTSAD